MYPVKAAMARVLALIWRSVQLLYNYVQCYLSRVYMGGGCCSLTQTTFMPIYSVYLPPPSDPTQKLVPLFQTPIIILQLNVL